MRTLTRIALVMTLLAGLFAAGCAESGQASVAEWPASASGRPILYYFGSPG